MTSHHKALIYLFFKLSFTLCTYLCHQNMYIWLIYILHTYSYISSNIHVQLNLKHLVLCSLLSLRPSILSSSIPRAFPSFHPFPFSLIHLWHCHYLFVTSLLFMIILFISLSLPSLSVSPFFFLSFSLLLALFSFSPLFSASSLSLNSILVFTLLSPH